MSRIQLKIIGALAALVVVVVATTGVLAQRGLRERTMSSINDGLAQQARLVGQRVAQVDFSAPGAPSLQSIAAESAVVTSARVTLVSPSGRVLADSAVPPDEVASLPNHGDRPEIAQALRAGHGFETRRSGTVKRPLVYVAVRLPADTGPDAVGVVRLALDLDQLDAAAAELRRELIVAGAIGMLAALGLSYMLSLLSLRPIVELREVVRDIATGRLDRRLGWETRDERGEIAISINRLARQMRDTMDEALREKVQLEAVLSSMVEGVIVIDGDEKVILANPRAREMLSIWGDFAGRPVPEVIRSPQIDQALQDASTSDEIVVREISVTAEKTRVLLMHATRFPKAAPRAGTVAVFHDVSELRRVDGMRRDFIANASHELRTPLTAIKGFADTLATTKVEPEQLRQYLDVIVRNAQRMSDLIDDLLTLSRIESGHAGIEIDEVDVARVVTTTMADFAPRFREASIEAKAHIDTVPMCLANRGALEQVLANLLSNAARYSNAGAHIDVYVQERDGSIVITVADTGIGIPARDIERIFERFYRVDAARSRALGSTGLGLSIVKHLVRAMHGEIRVESEIEVGSRFSISLPVA